MVQQAGKTKPLLLRSQTWMCGVWEIRNLMGMSRSQPGQHIAFEDQVSLIVLSRKLLERLAVLNSKDLFRTPYSSWNNQNNQATKCNGSQNR